MIGCEFGTGLGAGLGTGLGTGFDKLELMGSGTFPVTIIGCAGFCPNIEDATDHKIVVFIIRIKKITPKMRVIDSSSI
jgi:hypothetical protein